MYLFWLLMSLLAAGAMDCRRTFDYRREEDD